MPDDNRWRKLGESTRANSVAISIPLVLMSFPVAGGLIGKFLAEKAGWPGFVYVGVAVGLFGGIRECIRLVKLLNRIQK